ncbi:RluA family pseudouridine synthase [Fusibacter sp. JL298sf-3]
MEREIKLVSDVDGERIDVFLANEIEALSRSYIQKLIKGDKVTLNGKPLLSKKVAVKAGDEIQVCLPEPEPIDVLPEDLPLDIVYEDDDVLVVNKPQGMVVHPAPGHYTGTLVNALMYRADKLSSINGVIRPGIVHRIDKDTSGLLMVAKNDVAHEALAAQLKAKTSLRVYYALVNGVLKREKGTVDAPVARHPNDRKRMAIVKDGRQAVTHFEVLETYRMHTLVKLQLETGRTHQIRVHMASIGYPLVGDPVYGNANEKVKHDGQLLHAKRLGFEHPRTKEWLVFDSELPTYFVTIQNKCKAL